LHRKLILFGLILILFLYASSLYAQGSTSDSDSSEKITLNFDDEDVFAVIQTIFGDILKVNYIVDPQVKGRVNLRTVTPVSKKDVLPLMEVVLRINGISVVEENNLYRIVTINAMPKEPTAVGIGREAEKVRITGKALLQIVPLDYISSSEMIKILTPFLSSNSVIVDVPKSNHMIIVDTDANIKRLLQLVEIFDSERLKKIKPQVFVYPVQNSKAKDLAALLQQIFLGARQQTSSPVSEKGAPQPAPSQQPKGVTPSGGVGLVADITTIFPDELTNTIIILSTPEDYALISETIKKIDIVPRQVLIEGLIARVDLSDSLKFGIAWSLKTDLNFSLKPFTKDFNLTGEAGQRPSDLVDKSGAPATLSGTGFTFLASDTSGILRARIEALSSEGKVNVMAAPHILVSDNREARIQVGQQIPIPTVQIPTSGGQITSVQYKDIGIILKVKPQVNESGLVSLEITQEVSSSATSLADIAAGGAPVINKTEASTFLVAQDGETIIIGGLMREDTSKTNTGIPLLSKIPILGYLFGSTTKAADKIELVILLTPHVIKNIKDAGSVTSDYMNKFKDSARDKKIDEFIDNSSKDQEED
jgi:type II secretory pathway component GspD/PulD (secretin)